MRDFTLALVCFVLLMAWKTPPWVVVLIAGVGGTVLALTARSGRRTCHEEGEIYSHLSIFVIGNGFYYAALHGQPVAHVGRSNPL
jgi:hypothetical protein